MRNILENSRNLARTDLLPQQQILNRRHTLIHKMIPRARITVHHGGGLDILLPLGLATFAFKRIVRITRRVTMLLEQLPQTIESKMAFNVLSGIYDTGGERLLVRLPLEYLLFDGACGDEAVHEAVFLLTVSPDSC